MQTTPITKSTPMKMLERIHPGKTIDVIVREACERHDQPEAIAADLGVSLPTLRNWKRTFKIVDRKREAVTR